ncbi:MAG: TIR domain-containing protein [Leptolyngbya sp. SIO1D8]|nr:TIR domain-containing protein [Leptolyngbya sp. SIO1D8]
MTESTQASKKDFFISYTGTDQHWAEWIAWVLEEDNRYQVVIQAWDFRPGGNFVLDMQRATQNSHRMIAVLSEKYLQAVYTQPEWAAFFKQDPESLQRLLIPVRVSDCKPKGLLASIVYVDLVGTSRDDAKHLLLDALKERAKPDAEPMFPGEVSVAEPLDLLPERAKPTSQPVFPGNGEMAANGQNPFFPLVGGVEVAERFFNCERTLNRVFELLNAGSSVALIGETGLGKSSILWAIYRLAFSQLEQARTPIRLSLANVYSEADFYEDLCEVLGLAPQSSSNSIVRSLRKQRILLLLDEVERISQKDFPRRVREQLRGLAEGRDAPMRLVITARTSLDKLFSDSEVAGQTSPLEGICIEEPIQLWSEDTSRQFIAERLSDGPIQFSQIEIEQLVRSSHGNPQKLMQTCHQLYTRYQET